MGTEDKGDIGVCGDARDDDNVDEEDSIEKKEDVDVDMDCGE